MNMKIRHIALMLAATLWIGCGGSGDEPGNNPGPTPQPKERPIVFSGSLSDGDSETHAKTRSGDPVPLQYYPTEANGHTSFHVWSYKTKDDDNHTLEIVMKNYTVNWTSGSAGTTTSNTNGWEYVDQVTGTQTIKYWDFSADEYRFFGYSGSNDKVSVSYPSNQVELTFSIDPDDEAQVTASSPTIDVSTLPLYSRLWSKSGSDISLSVQPVTLQFLRPIARVRFVFTFAEGVSFERKDLHEIQFGPTNASSSDIGIAKRGTVTITYPLTGTAEESWTSSASSYYSPAYFEIDYYEDPTTEVVSIYPNHYPGNSHHWYYVLPRLGQGTGGQGPYMLSVTVKDNEPTTCEVPAEFMTWAPGHDYTYLFKMNASGTVSFDAVQVAVRKWNGKDPIDYPVYNW